MKYQSAIIFVVGLSIFFGGGRLCFSKSGSGTRPPRINRDLELERRVADRLSRLLTLVQRSAEKKLSAAAKEVIKALDRQPPPDDLAAEARREVEKAFPGLSEEQSAVGTFFVLALLAEAGAASLAREDLEGQRDSLTSQSSVAQLRLQSEMDHMSKSSESRSNYLKKFSEVSDQIIGNLK